MKETRQDSPAADRRRWVGPTRLISRGCRVLAFLVLLLPYFFASHWVCQNPQALNESQNAYQWHRWCTFSLPPDHVVYEEDPVAAARLLSMPPESNPMGRLVKENASTGWPRHSQPYSPLMRPVAMYNPPTFQALVQARHYALAFLHERRAAGGQNRLVVVYQMRLPSKNRPKFVDGRLVHSRPGIILTAESLKIGAPRPRYGNSSGDLRLMLGEEKVMRIYAGQPDPHDDAHFTIKYEIDNVPGLIDGRLEVDDTVTLRIVSGPAVGAVASIQPDTAPTRSPQPVP